MKQFKPLEFIECIGVEVGRRFAEAFLEAGDTDAFVKAKPHHHSLRHLQRSVDLLDFIHYGNAANHGSHWLAA